MHDDFIGTMPVPERHRFDVTSLERYLRDHVEGFSGKLEVEQFKGGQSNPTFMLKAGRTALCVATQAARQAAPVGACSRPRISRHYRVARQRLSGCENLLPV